jgi:dephospho-CoA kinase
MLKIGITGGIGSGKTTVCHIFEALGIPVYYADDRAKALMTTDVALVQAIQTNFGVESYFPDGSLNRAYLSNIVFKDAEKLALLNSLVHPAVFRDGEAWHAAQKNVPYTLKEAALLVETGSYKAVDKLITVFAPKKLRLQRVLKRDKVTRAAVLARMNKQMPERDKVKLADFIIKNDGQHGLIQQVWAVHQALLDELKTL